MYKFGCKVHNWNCQKFPHLVRVGTSHINSPLCLGLSFPFVLGGVGVGVCLVVLRLPVGFDVGAAGLGMAFPALGLFLDVDTLTSHLRPDLVVIPLGISPLGISPLVLFSEMET